MNIGFKNMLFNQLFEQLRGSTVPLFKDCFQKNLKDDLSIKDRH